MSAATKKPANGKQRKEQTEQPYTEKKAIRTILQSTEPATDYVSEEHHRLHEAMSVLSRFIDKAYPEGHFMRCCFRFTLHPHEDNFLPSLESLQLLRNTWMTRLAPDEQRRVLNGWAPEFRYPLLKQVIEETTPEIRRVLRIMPGLSAGVACADWEYVLDEGISGVGFYVIEGTTRDEALCALKAIVDYVTLYFDQAIVDPNKANANSAAHAKASPSWYNVVGYSVSNWTPPAGE